MSQHSAHDVAGTPLKVYDVLARIPRLGYGGKIMLVAFVGTHVPLIGLLVWLATTAAPDSGFAWRSVAATLVATLLGTGVTLAVLHHLLRPIALTSRGLRTYLADRTLPTLPSGYRDAVGTLMADTGHTLRRLDETIERLEHHDPVTGLPNRAWYLRALHERVESADAVPFAVCALSLERFDDIVSAFGHAHANRVLRLAVLRIENRLGHRVALSRIDTHSFACLPELGGVDATVRALEALDRDLKALESDGDYPGLGSRSGIALYPQDGVDAESLLDAATSARGVAARNARPIAFYSSASRAVMAAHYSLERDLARALDGEGEGGLTLHYQPVVDVDRGVIGAEALVRWQHPRLGSLAPEAFIPLAERSVLIEQLGRWTLSKACAQLALWRASGLTGFKVAVNVSARQFSDPTLPDYLAAALAEHAIEPGALELELTETSAMSDVEATGATMARVRALGVSIAIDDFGTGYSSMSHLRTMPFDRLKIDREFVQDAATNGDHRAICGALIALARELKLEVLAEGTETSSEVEMLRSQGCRMFQGFYFHRPMPAAAIQALLAGGRPVAIA